MTGLNWENDPDVHIILEQSARESTRLIETIAKCMVGKTKATSTRQLCSWLQATKVEHSSW